MKKQFSASRWHEIGFQAFLCKLNREHIKVLLRAEEFDSLNFSIFTATIVARRILCNFSLIIKIVLPYLESFSFSQQRLAIDLLNLKSLFL